MEYNNYITYSNGTDSLRVETINGEPWFFATDLVKLLEGKTDHTAYKMKKVAESEKKLVKRLVKSGVRNVYLANQLGFTTLSSESKCNKERVEEILDLMFGAIQMVRTKFQPFDVPKEVTTEEIKAEEPEAVEKPLEEAAEKPVVESKVEEEKATVEEKQVVNGDLTTFQNAEFGEIRTEVIDGEPWFVGKDVATILGYQNASKAIADHIDEEDKLNNESLVSLGQRGGWLINESGLYSLILSSKLPTAKRFKHWVTSEVLPSIRKTGGYQKPLTPLEQIQVIAQGTIELAQKVEKLERNSTQLERNLNQLEHDMPLYGCEIDEVQQHVKRKGVQCLGGKDSEAYADGSIRSQVYKDIYSQLKREYGCVSTYKSIKRKYIADVHDFIDCYQLPTVLEEQITAANAQQRLF